jgi:hypothetical protein
MRHHRSMLDVPTQEMASLVDEAVRYDLAESTCPALHLGELLRDGRVVPAVAADARGDRRRRHRGAGRAVATRAPGCGVLVDETYRAATYGEAPPPSAARLGPAVVTCSSLSKAHGAPGLRIGGWFGEEDRVFRLGFGHLPDAEHDEALARLADAPAT